MPPPSPHRSVRWPKGLLPELVSLLEVPRVRPAAVRALSSIAPAQYRTEAAGADLIDMIVAGVARTTAPYQEQAIQPLVVLGPSTLPAHAVDALRQLIPATLTGVDVD